MSRRPPDRSQRESLDCAQAISSVPVNQDAVTINARNQTPIFHDAFFRMDLFLGSIVLTFVWPAFGEQLPRGSHAQVISLIIGFSEPDL